MAALRSPGDEIDQGNPVTEEINWFVFARRGITSLSASA
jgi:hypothetical protein